MRIVTETPHCSSCKPPNDLYATIRNPRDVENDDIGHRLSTNPCKIEDVAYLLSPSYSGSSSKVGWAKPRLSPPQSSKSTSSKQKHTPIAHQHACFDFTCIRDVPCMSSRHVLLRTAIGATDGSDGWSLKKTWDRVLRSACQELEMPCGYRVDYWHGLGG